MNFWQSKRQLQVARGRSFRFVGDPGTQLLRIPLPAILSSLIYLACSPQKATIAPLQATLPMPSKDEIAVIDGRALTITHFLSIRRQMRQPSAESAYWLGLASLALEKDAKTKGKTFSLLDALLLSRYAIGDISRLEASAVLQAYFEPVAVPSTQEDVKKAVDQLLKRSWIQNGLIPISQL